MSILGCASALVVATLLAKVPTGAAAKSTNGASSAPPQASTQPISHLGAVPVATTLPAMAGSPVGLKFRLWNGEAPGAIGNGTYDIPTLTLFRPPPQLATGALVIICPGGGYTHYGVREGRPVAQWLNGLGINAAVLLYRLGSHGYRYPAPFDDVERAIRFMRANAGQWGLDEHRVGIIGFSAGGHLASTAATHFDGGRPDAADPIERVSSRPDLAMLIYPVITMGVFTNSGSRRNLLGDHPDPELVALLSNEKQVTPKTPPCFIVHGADDQVVPVSNSLAFAMACEQNRVPFELHIYEHGRHGFGLGGKDPALSTWPADATRFLSRHGFLNKHVILAPGS